MHRYLAILALCVVFLVVVCQPAALSKYTVCHTRKPTDGQADAPDHIRLSCQVLPYVDDGPERLKRHHISIYNLPGRNAQSTGWWYTSAKQNVWHCARCRGVHWNVGNAGRRGKRQDEKAPETVREGCCLAQNDTQAELHAKLRREGNDSFEMLLDQNRMETFGEGRGAIAPSETCGWNCAECGVWNKNATEEELNRVKREDQFTNVEYVLGPCDWTKIVWLNPDEDDNSELETDLMQFCPEMIVGIYSVEYEYV